MHRQAEETCRRRDQWARTNATRAEWVDKLLTWAEGQPSPTSARCSKGASSSRNVTYRSGIFGASDGLTYRVSVGPIPVICTSTASAPVRAK
jgi:hypothetical protein